MPLEAFIALLQRHHVTAVADVRAAPYSRFNPQFNRQPLAAALGERGIEYVFLGRELGGRSGDPSCYENGRIRYARLPGRNASATASTVSCADAPIPHRAHVRGEGAARLPSDASCSPRARRTGRRCRTHSRRRHIGAAHRGNGSSARQEQGETGVVPQWFFPSKREELIALAIDSQEARVAYKRVAHKDDQPAARTAEQDS